MGWNYLSIPKLHHKSLEWICNFISYFMIELITHPCWDWTQCMFTTVKVNLDISRSLIEFNFQWAPGNIQGNLTGMHVRKRGPWYAISQSQPLHTVIQRFHCPGQWKGPWMDDWHSTGYHHGGTTITEFWGNLIPQNIQVLKITPVIESWKKLI